MAYNTRYSNVNGKATRLGSKLSTNTVNFILTNAGRLSAVAIANIIHRPVKTVYSVASRNGVSLKVG